ncbi:MAG TPA: hypothetical protein VHD90_16995 [Phototrophicaceae bacterium]|nr:hypothetical protein [Phototrophicaceae bacterium]
MTVSIAEALAMLKHLPPSASTLRLFDLNGLAGKLLAEQRADLAVTVGASGDASAANSFDAVVAYGTTLDDESLHAALIALRPGGRLIAVDPQGDASGALVKRLESAGYIRILVEELSAEAGGVLMRGEKPHVSEDTLARIQSVAVRDAGEFKGRYLHLLIRQTPNKPVWALKPDDVITWEAVALADTGELLAFSSLPNAVAFMQPAVIAGKVKDVNKVGKFSREAAKDWPVLINPSLDLLQSSEFVLVPIDPSGAEKPDE